MKRQGGLFQRTVDFKNLHAAAQLALRGKRDRGQVARFFFHLENELIRIQAELESKTYRPRPYRQFEIREPKVRQICSSDFRDRVVHHSICRVIDPILEARLIHDTYACRVGKGSHRALKRCQVFARRYRYSLKCDIRKYFESIDHGVLKGLIRRVIKDGEMLGLIDIVIDHGVPGADMGKGLPIGNLTSQHFANAYLGELDHFLKDRKRVPGYVRYMDDFILFSNDKEQLHAWLCDIRVFLAERLKLELKEKVTRIAPVTEGVPFLGFWVFPGLIRIQRPNLVRFRRNLRTRERQFRDGVISARQLTDSVNSMLGHISHADSLALRRKELIPSTSLA